MNSKIAWTWIVCVMAALLWLPGFWGQKTNNAAAAKDYSIVGSGVWTYLLGVRPRVERVYLRIAYVQTLGLVYLIVGLSAIWFYDTSILRILTPGILGGGFVVGGLVWLVIDLTARRRRRRR
jgi:hypothetical protein